MKTILVPVDYSGNSRSALSCALDLAKTSGADVILFHAFYPIMSPPATFNVTDVIQALEEGKARSLMEFGEEIRKEVAAASGEAAAFRNIRLQASASMGGSYEKILEAIDKYKPDLVVMGMQGGEAVSQALLGSTTISVMQESPVPILAVPRNAKPGPFTSVVFAANLSKLPPNANLHPLTDFINTCHAQLEVLHLYRNQEQKEKFNATEALNNLERSLQGVKYHVSFEVQEDVATGIQQFVKDKNGDLLVLIPQHHSFLERLLNRSVTGRITPYLQVPLLALPTHTLSPSQSNLSEELFVS
ncbi:universal stress protein [Pontibacter mangrovi]|nr:universal stress protein [Pontibacter mangrovi]